MLNHLHYGSRFTFMRITGLHILVTNNSRAHQYFFQDCSFKEGDDGSLVVEDGSSNSYGSLVETLLGHVPKEFLTVVNNVISIPVGTTTVTRR
jgi:hypothetical protein